MSHRIRDSSWAFDANLKDQLKTLIASGLSRAEILSYMKRDFGHYAWSIRTLDRRLRFFDIFQTDRNVSVDCVRNAVKKELAGPGNRLGYRALHQKVRQVHGLLVLRANVYALLMEQDPKGLEDRRPGAKKKKARQNFTSPGPNFVWSLDGHDKLMGYQNSTFPLAVYGCIDTASRKILWLKCWTSNSNPILPCRWYFDYLLDTLVLPKYIRIDHGTETGEMATLHAFLRCKQPDINFDTDAVDTVIYGPSTSNQIERWWRELHDRLEKYFKLDLKRLKDEQRYDPHQDTDRNMLAYIMVPVIQRELNVFRDLWNNHRIRNQNGTQLPDGVPNHIYDFPEEYDMENCGMSVGDDDLKDAALHSNVLYAPSNFIAEDVCDAFRKIVPCPELVENDMWVDVYLHLKENYTP